MSHHDHDVNVDEFWVGHTQQVKPADTLTAMPSARLLAQKLGVDLNSVSGSGPSGVILDTDVYNACDKLLPGTEVLKGARRTMVSTMQSHTSMLQR